MSTQQQPRRQARQARVLRTSYVTPHMVRVVLGGDGLADFTVGTYSDHYVKLIFPPPSASYSHPFDVEAVQAERPREEWPITRTYTVRAWDSEQHELTIDFVVHGDEGVAGPWAAGARPGDLISLYGPGGAFVPDASAQWYLFVGDESALPAIAASLERVPAGAPVLVFAEVEDAAEEQPLPSPGDVDLTWVHRAASSRPPGQDLVDAVRGAELPAGSVHAFVHGDAGFVRDVRRYLRVDRGVPTQQLSVSGYWRRGRTEEGWRAEKKDWNLAVEQDEAGASAASGSPQVAGVAAP